MSVGTKMGTVRYHFHFAGNTTYSNPRPLP
jgi:hypothetical protein